MRLIALGALLAVASVAVPALIAPGAKPHPTAPADRRPTLGSAPPATAAPTASTSPTPTAGPVGSAPAASTAHPCGATVPPGAVVAAGSTVSCTALAGQLGVGWTLTGSGTQLGPGERVPGRTDTGLRVEVEADVATVVLSAAAPVSWGAEARLHLRVYGGRVNGTALRIRASPAGPAVTLSAPPDRWTSFSVAFPGTPSTLDRIIIEVAQDLVPRSYRFFLDQVELTPSS